jgi:hypothetical protein
MLVCGVLQGFSGVVLVLPEDEAVVVSAHPFNSMLGVAELVMTTGFAYRLASTLQRSCPSRTVRGCALLSDRLDANCLQLENLIELKEVGRAGRSPHTPELLLISNSSGTATVLAATSLSDMP